jgi:hypothetical protein
MHAGERQRRERTADAGVSRGDGGRDTIKSEGQCSEEQRRSDEKLLHEFYSVYTSRTPSRACLLVGLLCCQGSNEPQLKSRHNAMLKSGMFLGEFQHLLYFVNFSTLADAHIAASRQRLCG